MQEGLAVATLEKGFSAAFLIPAMEDFYIGGASVKLFLPIFKMAFTQWIDALFKTGS